MLFNEPKLLKSFSFGVTQISVESFSALQRAEIAEIEQYVELLRFAWRFSALQRAEIAEMKNG